MIAEPWDAYSIPKRITLQRDAGRVFAVAFTPDGRTLASANEDGSVRLWDVAAGRERSTLAKHEAPVFCLAFAPNGQMLASGGEDGTIVLWDVPSGMARATLKAPPEWDGLEDLEFFGTLLRPEAVVEEATINGNAAEMNGHQAELDQLEDPPEVLCLAFAPDGQTLASGSFDGTVRLWDMDTGDKRATLPGHKYQVWSVAFSPDGQTLATGGGDGTVRVWNAVTGKVQQLLQVHGMIFSVAYAPDGKTLAAGSWALGEDHELVGCVTLWDTATYRKRATLKVHRDAVLAVTYSPDGKTLVTGGGDPLNVRKPSRVTLWDLATGQRLITLRGHTSLVWSVTYSPDGWMLASGSNDGTTKLWNLAVRPRASAPSESLHGSLDVSLSPQRVPWA